MRLTYLREGDVFVITRLSRAMRSLRGRLVFHILGAIDEFQRELIIEGTREGLDAARARGRAGGRRPKLSDAKAATVRRIVLPS